MSAEIHENVDGMQGDAKHLLVECRAETRAEERYLSTIVTYRAYNF